MKIVFDTNVLIASIISHGACFELFGHCLKNHNIYASTHILEEFVEKLVSKFKYSKNEASNAKTVVFERIKIIEPKEMEGIDMKDKDDIPIIGTAFSANCKYLITGDKELLKLKKYKIVNIISPAEFWKIEK